MPNIFISYRRDESLGYAGRIYERLADLYGADSVFRDVDDIGPGADFAHVIDRHIAACDVLLVLISKQWLTLADSSGLRRVDNPDDFVRIEITKALKRKVRIIPLLLNNASMPAERDLPDEMKGFVRHQAMELTEQRWEYDFRKLTESIAGASAPRRLRRNIVAAIVVLAAALAGAIAWLKEPAAIVTGRWTATVQYEFGGRYMESFDLEQHGANIRGAASFLGVERAITEGTINGDSVSFVTHSSEMSGDEHREITHRYNGKLSHGEIRFMMQTTGATSSYTSTAFIARRDE